MFQTEIFDSNSDGDHDNMPQIACKGIYRGLVEQYLKKDAALNKNPILFLNKLTHLKMYFDGFRYIEFDVQRKEPVEKNGIFFEDSVMVSIDMKDYNNGVDRAYKSDIDCYRYTMPIIYGQEECVSRYGEDVAFTERKHNIIAVFPKETDEFIFIKHCLCLQEKIRSLIKVILVIWLPSGRLRVIIAPEVIMQA